MNVTQALERQDRIIASGHREKIEHHGGDHTGPDIRRKNEASSGKPTDVIGQMTSTESNVDENQRGWGWQK